MDDTGASEAGEGQPRATPIPLRLPGCLTGVFMGLFVFAWGMATFERVLPTVLMYFGGAVTGILLTRQYAIVGERRWGAKAPDGVQMLATDLRMLRLRAPDHRLRLPQGAPIQERLLHEALYALKWAGNFVLIVTIAAAMYQVMQVKI